MTMTLQDKIEAVFAPDDLGDGPLGRAGAQPAGGGLTDFELDVRDWGVFFGVAFGIARGEDPFEASVSVTERAYQAALPAYERHIGGTLRRGEVSA